MLTKKIKSIGIIGAGISGLAAARLLKQAGFQCELFEQGSQVGGVWTGGYHTFGLQTPKSLYEVPDYPMPDSYPRVPSGEELQAYFENYAKDFNVYNDIHFNTTVKRLEQQSGGSWVVEFTESESGGLIRKSFDFVIVATGLYFDPFIPDIPGRQQYSGTILHSSEYRSPSSVTGKRVAVIGFGKSALDVVGEVTKFAKSVALVYRKAHWPIPMDILNFLDVRRIYLTRFICGFLPLYQRPETWEKLLHQYCPWLVSGFWRLTEAIIKFQYPMEATNTLADEPFEIDIFNLDFLPRKKVYQLMRKGTISNYKTAVEGFFPGGLQLANGDKLECDVVIFGTGYRSRLDFLPKSFTQTQEYDGNYLYRHIIHPDIENMAFIGRGATFSNSLTAHLASVWLIHLLKGTFKLPEKKQMLAEIDSMKQWKRGFMPAIGSRATVIKLHMTHYHDELLKDALINPKRKSNFLAEWFQDYRPKDYRGVLEAIKDGSIDIG